MTLVKGARVTSNGALALTNSTQNVTGRAFFSSPFLFFTNIGTSRKLHSFSTHFVFAIVTPPPGTSGGHGLCFVVSPHKLLPAAGTGQYMGLFGKTNDGNSSNHVLAVEFDIVQGSGLFGDINDNHVGIDVNSLRSTASKPASFYTNGTNQEDINLGSGASIQAWVDYDAIGKVLKVTISPLTSVQKPTRPLLTHIIDVSTILKESMYVGFTSATGKLASSHYLLGWSFSMNGPAPALDLSRLPSPPSAFSQGLLFKVRALIIGLSSSALTLMLLVLALYAYFYVKRRAKLKDVLEGWELEYPHRFRYRDLHEATKGFKESEILGSGGFGCVYKGIMPSTKEEVAIKRISHSSRQGVREFVAEIASLGRLRHRHLVRLLGWCKWKGDLLIVYEYMTNGGLDDFLFGKKNLVVLTWMERFKILKGIASALLYLHEDWEQVVVHRDVKASNVLLDGCLNGKLGDFGLARLYDHGSNPRTTHVVGTLGYMAPEISRGKPTTSSDVFAYGALLLEVACGRMPIEPDAGAEQLVLLDWVRQCWLQGQIMDAMDPKLGGEYVAGEAELVLTLGLLCSQYAPGARPTIRQVTQYLDGQDSLPELNNLSLDLASLSTDREFGTSIYATSYGVISTSSIGSGR